MLSLRSSTRRLGAVVAVVAAAFPAAAIDVTPTSTAATLAAAAAPAPGLATLVGQTLETGADATGTFINGDVTLGFPAGIVLSTGSTGSIFTGAPGGASTDLGFTGSATTQARLGQVPGVGSPVGFDASRLVLDFTVDPAANFLNFRVGFGTNEFGVSNDRFGIFLDGVFVGEFGGAPLSQFNSLVVPASSTFGFDVMLTPTGNPLDFPSALVSIGLPVPGAPVSLEFVLGDSVDGFFDTAVFVGEITATPDALGTVIPEPSAAALLAGAVVGLLAWRRRRSA